MLFYHDLTGQADSVQLDPPPSELWALVSFEFPIFFENKKFILLTHPYYGSPQSGANLGEGILYPPFTATHIDMGFFKPRTLGDARKRFASIEKSLLSRQGFEQTAYNQGLGEPEFEILPPIDELKTSPREHDIWKFFRILRVRAWNHTEKGRRNIADPERIKGHFFVPLDLSVTSELAPGTAGPHRHRFTSKILGSHFGQVSEFYSKDNQPEKYTALSRNDTINREKGYLLFFDISGFGTLNQLTETSLSNPLESGLAIAEKFRGVVVSMFEEFCAAIGSAQIRVMGDGFICGCPARFFGNDDTLFATRFIMAWQQLSASITRMNAQLGPSTRKLGSRMIVVSGEYLYGRVGGLVGLTADFDGGLLIRGARLEQFVGRLMREGKLQGQHYIGLGEEVANAVKEAVLNSGMNETAASGQEKEAAIKLRLFAQN
jgi:hypothetical protein